MKIQSTQVNTKKTEILELPEEYFKADMIKMHQWAIENTLETNEKIENLHKEIESFNTEDRKSVV